MQTAHLPWLASFSTVEYPSSDAGKLHVGPKDLLQVQKPLLKDTLLGRLRQQLMT